MSVRMKAALIIMAIISVFTGSFFISGLAFTRQSMNEAMKHELSFALDIADRFITARMNLLKSDAFTVAERITKANSIEEMTAIMASQIDTYPEFISLTVYDRKGIVANLGEPINHDAFFIESNYIMPAFEGVSVISTTHYNNISGAFIMHVFVPMGSDYVLSATIPGMVFADMVSDLMLWETGNIFIVDENGKFIAHNRPYLVLEGHNFLEDVKSDPDLQSASTFYQNMLAGGHGSGNYTFNGKERFCIYKRLTGSKMGWHIGVVGPLDESPYSNVQNGLLLSFLLFLAAGAIISSFVSKFAVQHFSELEKLNETINAQAAKIQEEHVRARLLLNATPLACRLWNREHEIFACNEESVVLFKLKDENEFMNRYFELSPKYQPDGQCSHTKAITVLNKAFDEGRCVIEWMNQLLDGTPMPTEVTLVRVPYGNDYVVAGYTRDLREHKKMMKEIEQRDNLLNTVNRVASILLQSGIGDFENDLHRCMRTLAETTGVNRVYIWKNHAKDGKFHCTQLYEWSSGVESQQDSDFTVDSSHADIIPEWEATLSNGNCISGLVCDMPDKVKTHLSAQGVLSIFVAPVFLHDQFWGFFGYDDCSRERVFSENEQSILRSGGLVIASALLRNEMLLDIHASSMQLEAALNDAQRANAAKSAFLAKMSHEMRTPLNAIIGLSELSLEADRLHEKDHKHLETIRSAGATLLSTVNDILDISKIEAGKLELTPIEYLVPSLINDTVSQNVIRIGEKPIEFVLDIGGDIFTRLYGDDLRIKQIADNLLSNAIKYTHEGIVELKMRCEREHDAVWLIIQVRDTGTGILPEDMEKLFSDYAQVAAESHRKIEGTGLGLSIVKRLVEAMDGKITAESEYGKGSVFTVKLRQQFVTDACLTPEVVESLKHFRYSDTRRRYTRLKRVCLPYARVLVVDDNLTNLDITKGLLEPYGMQVDRVSSGQKAVDAIRAEEVKYSAIFMDHMMPGMNGIETAQAIRDIDADYARNIPIIALTADVIAGNEEMFLSKGFQAFLAKPIDILRLDEVIRHWVRDEKQEKMLANQGFFVNNALLPELENGWERRSTSCRRSGIDRRLAQNKLVGLNIDKGIQWFDGDEEAYLEVLRSFTANTRALLESIENVSEDRLADYAITVHGIRGSSLGIFADLVGEAAGRLEKAAKTGDFGYVAAHNRRFLDAAWKLVDDLEGMLQDVDVANCKPIKDKPDDDILSKLRSACEIYDVDGVDEAMRVIANHEYESDGGLAAWLKQNVKSTNYKQIVKKLSDLSAQEGKH